MSATTISVVRIERFNKGRMRRYHFNTGAVAVISRSMGSRRCVVIPAAFPCGVSVPVEPELVASHLRMARL